MRTRLTIPGRTIRTSLAVVVAAFFVSAAAWHGFAADQQSTSAPAKFAQSSPITRAPAGGRDSYADVVNVAAPAVVTVRVAGKAKASPTDFQDGEDLLRRFFGPEFGQGQGQRQGPRPQMRTPRQRGLGSGVMMTTDGYILTNYHVVDGADEIKVDLNDDRTLTAKLVGSDKASDLALLKVSGSDFKAMPLGNSDQVQVGDVVLAVGNPLGVGQTVTMGIISAKGRSTGVGDGSYEDFLQTDAPINHGNSGGALVNTKGELVGINSQILSSNDGNIGIGFAIPVNMAKHVMDELRTHGKVTRSQLGVTVQTVTPELRERTRAPKDAQGLVVEDVNPDGRAAAAGIQPGDIIEEVNRQPVKSVEDLRSALKKATERPTLLLINREGSDIFVTVRPANG